LLAFGEKPWSWAAIATVAGSVMSYGASAAARRGEVHVTEFDRDRVRRSGVGDDDPARTEQVEVVVDRARGALGRVHRQPGLEVAPDRVRGVEAAHEIAVQVDRPPGLAGPGDAGPGDARCRGQDELDRVLHRLRRVVQERVHRPRADIDREDPLVGHA